LANVCSWKRRQNGHSNSENSTTATAARGLPRTGSSSSVTEAGRGGGLGLPLAFHAGAIRDVDETYLDGMQVGRTGSFPPDPDLATIQFRLYALPTDLVNAPGLRVLAIRVYQGPSLTPVFRFPPEIDALAVTQRQSWTDQVLAAMAGVALSLVVAFVLAYRTAREETVSLVFAAFSGLIGLYVLSGHSLWGALSIPPRVPHRIVMITGPLLCLLYYSATWRLLEVSPPRRFRAYSAAFLAYALLGALAPDLRVLVVPTRIVRALALICLAEMLVPTLKAVRARRPRARSVLAGHLVFGLAIVWGNFTLLRGAWFYSWLGVALVLLAVTLYRLASQQVEARVAAVLAERGRIAREIHDNLAQGLVAISLQLDSVSDTLSAAPESARGYLERARGLVRSSLAEARRSVWDLHPALLEGRDLASALAQTAQRLGSGRPAWIDLVVRGRPSSLPAVLERDLLQIGKEAIANAVTHAEASRVTVTLDFAAAAVVLSVADNGRGFQADPQGWPSHGHFGLLGMRERATQLGGRLTVDSRPGAGTTVVAAFPLGSRSSPAQPRPDLGAQMQRRWLRNFLNSFR
jgi:signal transduction histidine kinase